MKNEQFTRKIIEWYKKNGRDFPWRNTDDSYKIFVTEILLQKTKAKQVEKIYHQFFSTFPSMKILANADIEEIKENIKSLGLFKRAKFLKSAGEIILKKYNGKIPNNPKELRKIKGIGRYTSNAIVCLTFNKRVPMVDSNVARIIRRYFHIETENSVRRDKKLWDTTKSILPKKNVKDFNFGMIDIGSLICKPKNTLCSKCPVKRGCFAQDEFG